jgi:hypothetical protein
MKKRILLFTTLLTTLIQTVFFAQSTMSNGGIYPVKSFNLPGGGVIYATSYKSADAAKTISTTAMMTAKCPVPVWYGIKTLNCTTDSTLIGVSDSAFLVPSGGYMSPGYRFELSGLDGLQCSQNRLEVWTNGKLTNVFGINTTSCKTGCTYYGSWSAVFGNCSSGMGIILTVEHAVPTTTTEIRVYDSGSSGNFGWKMVDIATGNLAGSGTWNFASIGTGYGTTGVFSKANGINQGTATYSCPTCTPGSLKDYNSGSAAFYPAKTAPGKYGITYTFNNGIGCSNSFTDTITTSANPGWKSPDSVCVNGTYDLNKYLTGSSTLGGTWSGTGVTGSSFKPLTKGLISVTYTIAKGSGCETKEIHAIKVVNNASNYITSWQAPATLCATSLNSFNLNTFLSTGSTTGGTWSGNYVTGNVLTAPSYATSFDVTYTLGAGTYCEAKETHTIEVNDLNSANWISPDSVCLSGSYKLDDYLSGMSSRKGTWSGKNVSGNIFTPVDSGNYTIIYTASKGTICVTNASHSIFVKGIKKSQNAAWTPPALLCMGSNYNLNLFLDVNSAIGGTWSGTGVIGNNFSSSTGGQFSITYTIGSGTGCGSSVTHAVKVSSLIDANWVAPDTLCVGNAFNLNDYLTGSATPGGTWSGTGVSANNFYPNVTGTYTITYTVAKGTSCEKLQTHSIYTIVDKTANAEWKSPVWICAGSTYNLNNYLQPSSTKGGTWSGSEVVGNNFIAKTGGAYSVTYTLTGKLCISKVTHTINVLSDSLKNASWYVPFDTACTYYLNNYLTTNATRGGQWSGQNVYGDYFIPNGPGSYTVTYTLAGGTLCETKITQTINTYFVAEQVTWLTDSCKLVWPGDANRDLVADKNDILAIGVAYGSTGQPRDSSTIEWRGLVAPKWGMKLINGKDYKNVDCNGDGIINAKDTIAVIKNYGLTHNFKEAQPVYVNGLPDLFFSFPADTVKTGSTISVPILLGTATTPANGIYGIAFTVKYDPTLIDTSEIGLLLNGSWLGTSGTNLISITKNFSSFGQMDIAIVRTNQQNVSGYGKIAELNFRVKDDVSGQPSGTIYKTLTLETSKLKSISSAEVIIPVNVGKDSVVIKNAGPLGIRQHTHSGSVKVYPNPTSGIINVDINMVDVKLVRLINILGETVRLISSNIGNKLTIDTESLPQGIYYLSVITSQEMLVKQVNIIR